VQQSLRGLFFTTTERKVPMNLFKSMHARAIAVLTAAMFAVMATAAPAQAFKISAAVGDAMLTTLKAKPNSGSLVIYSGTQPTNPDTALSGNTALATFTFSAAACGSNSTSGSFKVCTLSFAASTVTASATGTATFARMLESDGTTVDGDWTVSTTGADINLNSTSITSGGNVTLSTMQLKMPID
jgi:hypothetical protein